MSLPTKDLHHIVPNACDMGLPYRLFDEHMLREYALDEEMLDLSPAVHANAVVTIMRFTDDYFKESTLMT